MWLYLEFIKKYKIYVAVIAGICAVLLLCMFLSNDKTVPLKKTASSEDEMVYFDVNSQKEPAIPPAQQTQQLQPQQIDDAALQADKYNQEMLQSMSQPQPQQQIAPRVKIPPQRQSMQTFEAPPMPQRVVPRIINPTPKHYKRVQVRVMSRPQGSRHYRQHNYVYRHDRTQKIPEVCVQRALHPRHYLAVRRHNKAVPYYAKKSGSREICAVKLEYANAFEVAKFLNQNVPSGGHKFAIPKGNGELFLVGPNRVINTAEKVIALLDTHPKVGVFKLNYTTPSKMANMIANSVFGGDCDVLQEGTESPCHRSPFSVYFNNAQNSITIVGASSKQMDLAQEFINFSDTKSPQAFLDILLVEFNDAGSRQFQKASQFNVDSCAADYGICGHNIYSTVANIIYNGGGKILAKPRLTVANDSDYHINVTSDYVHSRNGKYAYNLEDCGTKLKIHSVINPKGEVFLTLEPQYVTIKRVIPNERNAKATLFNRKSFRYENIRLQNQQTLCLGGVTSQQEYSSFGRKKVVNSELMMFVNVHVLN